MNKPWDNEPTPFSDRLVDEHGDFFISQTTVENLKRRLRHADDLLRRFILYSDNRLHDEAVTYMEAAGQEDWR